MRTLKLAFLDTPSAKNGLRLLWEFQKASLDYQKLNSDNKNVRFDLIIPGISMLDSSNKTNITSLLDSAEVNARIINLDTVLILDEPLPMTSPYDNRFNTESNYKSGINNYSSSRLKETLLFFLLLFANIIVFAGTKLHILFYMSKLLTPFLVFFTKNAFEKYFGIYLWLNKSII